MNKVLYFLAVVIGSLLTTALVYAAYLKLSWGSPYQTLSGTLMFLAMVVVLLDLLKAHDLRRNNNESHGAFGLISSLVLIVVVLTASTALGVIPGGLQLTVLLACAIVFGVYVFYRVNGHPRTA